MLLTSPRALGDSPPQELVKALKELKSVGNPVALISNHVKPSWFDELFGDSTVQFLTQSGRQNGKIVSENATKLGLKPCDTIVLAGCMADIKMGKNGSAVVVAAGWSDDKYLKSLGIRVDNAKELQEVFKLTSEWSGEWWYSGRCEYYSVKSLADLSTYGKAYGQAEFASRLQATVKNGGSKLNSLLAVTARSLLMDDSVEESNLVWGVYPSSSSANNDSEVLSDFTHRLRTTTSKVQFAKRDIPLFIRHKPSAKRSAGKGGDRKNPTEQIQTIHLNPHYAGKLKGKHVIVVDDCTTYGISFAVASAFLRKAGAVKVTGIALGKFGGALKYYNITISTDPFVPVQAFSIQEVGQLAGSNNSNAQNDLSSLV
jgi:hypothetical protein